MESLVLSLILRAIPPMKPLNPNKPQSFIMPGDGPEGGRVRRSMLVKDGPLVTTPYPGRRRIK